jgi:hypothetical protein
LLIQDLHKKTGTKVGRKDMRVIAEVVNPQYIQILRHKAAAMATDHTTRLALWSSQGMKRCRVCGGKVYNYTAPGGLESLEHVDTHHSTTSHEAR